MSYLKYFRSFIIIGCSIHSVLSDCVLNLNKDLPEKNDPVYLVKNKGSYELALPEPGKGAIVLQNLQSLFLSCTGSKNGLSKASGAADTESVCASESTLTIDGTSYNSAELNCTSKSSASLLFTARRCNGVDVVIEMGFQDSYGWFPLVTTCYNNQSANTQWSLHTLYGSRLEGRAINSDRPSFVTGDRRIQNPDSYYRQQDDIFNSYYGTNKHINRSSQHYLARGHLSPDSDFLFSSWQMLTYFYVNTAPQWQIINNGNWKILENNLRSFAVRINADLEDYTGTYGILSLADSSGVNKPAYLDPDRYRFPVAELFWKILRKTDSNECIALVTTNNPYLDSPPKTICPDICSTSKWPVLQDDLSKGFVYCCDYQSFSAAAPNTPPLVCSSVLNYN